MTKKVATKQVSKEKNVEVGVAVTKQSRQDEVRTSIKDARKQVETGYVHLARLMAETYHKEYFREWGHASFEDYCTKELDYQYRKAMYLVEIADKMKSLNISDDKATKIGWTKMKELVQVMNAENAAEWLKRAKDMSTKEVIEEVKITRHADPTANVRRPMFTKLSFTLGESEASVILDAIEEAKTLADSDSQAVALEMICQDWLMFKGARPTRSTVDSVIAYVSKAFGIDLVPKGADTAAPPAAEKKSSKASKKEEKAPSKAKSKKSTDTSDLLEEVASEEDNDDDDAPAPEQDLNSLFEIE